MSFRILRWCVDSCFSIFNFLNCLFIFTMLICFRRSLTMSQPVHSCIKILIWCQTRRRIKANIKLKMNLLSILALNGAHSPHSTLSGRTPSPPSMGHSTSSQQLPPACGARQLSKLKRFLTTLQQFGSDISPEIGERVRSLVLGLVVSLFCFN